mmetsp:Transcript_44979/g.57583  ORF Transcript_44979/g.57583 Transcript_44979/m.57583 type:complete len:255 (+) Transcript_44979:21-785(+)
MSRWIVAQKKTKMASLQNADSDSDDGDNYTTPDWDEFEDDHKSFGDGDVENYIVLLTEKLRRLERTKEARQNNGSTFWKTLVLKSFSDVMDSNESFAQFMIALSDFKHGFHDSIVINGIDSPSGWFVHFQNHHKLTSNLKKGNVSYLNDNNIQLQDRSNKLLKKAEKSLQRIASKYPKNDAVSQVRREKACKVIDQTRVAGIVYELLAIQRPKKVIPILQGFHDCGIKGINKGVLKVPLPSIDVLFESLNLAKN